MAKQPGGAFAEILAHSTSSGEQDANEQARQRYLAVLNSYAPSQWQTDHLKEDMRLRGAIYVAIKVLADQAASAQLNCYKWDDAAREDGNQDHKKPLPRDHSLCEFLRRPNRHESGAYLRRKMVQQLSLTGTSLLWRVDNGLGRPIEMWSVPTGTYQPVAISAQYPDGAYRIMPWLGGPIMPLPGLLSQGGVVVNAKHIMATRYPHPLVQHEGLSPLSACDLAMDTIENIDRARSSTMRRGAYPSLIVEQDLEMKQPDPADLLRVQTQLYQLIGSPDRAGKVAILSGGMKANPYKPGDVELGWIESWSQLVEFTMSIFGIAKSVAFMSEATTYAALYAALKQFNLFTLVPLLSFINDSFNMQLVEPFWGRDYYVELEPKKIDDDTVLEAQLGNDLRAGIRTVNEIRALRGLEKVSEPWGEDRAFAAPPKDEAKQDSEDKPKPEAQEVAATKPKNPEGVGSLYGVGGRQLTNGNGKHKP